MCEYGFMEWKRPILTLGIGWSDNCRYESIQWESSSPLQHRASSKYFQCQVPTADRWSWNCIVLWWWSRIVHRTNNRRICKILTKNPRIELTTSTWKWCQRCQPKLFQLPQQWNHLWSINCTDWTKFFHEVILHGQLILQCIETFSRKV